jgi:hypothetical protein
MFDQSKTVTLKGTVTQFQWTNPHSLHRARRARPGGRIEHWSIELNSPNNLTRQGWKPTSIKPGDKVTVTINPLRNGKKGGLFNTIVLPDGHILAASARRRQADQRAHGELRKRDDAAQASARRWQPGRNRRPGDRASQLRDVRHGQGRDREWHRHRVPWTNPHSWMHLDRRRPERATTIGRSR